MYNINSHFQEYHTICVLDYGTRIRSEEIFNFFVLKRLKFRRALATRYDRKFRVPAMWAMICTEVKILAIYSTLRSKIYKDLVLRKERNILSNI